MLIDCDTCVVRDVACSDCVVAVLLETPTVPARPAGDGGRQAPAEPGDPLPAEFGPAERRALDVLADHGLIPRLRLVQRPAGPAEPPAASPQGRRATGRTHRDGRRDAG